MAHNVRSTVRRAISILSLVMMLVLAGRTSGAAMEFVRVSGDGRGFILSTSGRRFVPWGLNYGNSGRLLEDFWDAEWPTVVRDFAQMKALGANVVRVHLQFGKFMDAADRPNPHALARLGDLLALAERTGLYLDVTGLGCYRTKDVPAWYDAMDEQRRWEAQGRFWQAVATRCADSPAVFCYDLMNEPLAPGGRRKAGQWYSGSNLGGYDFLQFISLDQRDRPREQVAREWIATLSRAIRRADRRHLITVGLLPWGPQWGYLSGFIPEKVAPELDFICVHIYPEAGKLPEALAGLKKFAVGKPLVIEETFPLSCSTAELKQFLLESRALACGWMGHYDGKTIADLEPLVKAKTITINQQLFLDWLRLFRDLREPMQSSPSAPPSTAKPTSVR